MKKQVKIDNEIVEVEVIEESSNFVLFNFEGEQYGVNLESGREGKYILNYKNTLHTLVNSENAFVISGREIEVALPSRTRNKIKQDSIGGMISPMPGKILKIFKNVGDVVLKGDPIIVMEAMKMEHTIKASTDGKIEKIFFKEGDQVQAKVELVKLC